MLYTAEKNGHIDGTVYRIGQLINSDVPIVAITRIDGFQFNDALRRLDKYVLIDYCEYGWDWDRKQTHLFGKNTRGFKHIFKEDGYTQFCDWVKENPPLVYFKRELLAQDVQPGIEPIDYPNWIAPIPVQTKEEYEARPIELFNFWGHSHEVRRKVHGEIWFAAPQFGYTVCDNIHHINLFMQHEENPHKWITLNMPHYARIDINHIIQINGQSKLSVSLPGAGVKCFRSTGESPVNSVMLCQEDNLAWRHKWVDNVNCIKVNINNDDPEEIKGENPHVAGRHIRAAHEALKWNPNLYDVYLAGVETANKYYYKNYLAEIEEAIKHYL